MCSHNELFMFISLYCTIQVLLVDELAESVKQGRTYQSTHPVARSVEGLAKSSLLKECHITGVPPAWFTEETERAQGKGRKRRGTGEALDDVKHK